MTLSPSPVTGAYCFTPCPTTTTAIDGYLSSSFGTDGPGYVVRRETWDDLLLRDVD
jgi:hypothetical protein